MNLKLAECYEKTDNPEKALVYYINNISLGNNGVEIIFKAGVVCKNLGKLDDAEYFYKLALNTMPENHLIYYNIGNLYYMKNDFINALEWFEKAYYLEKNDTKVLNNIASSYYNIGELGIAEEFYIKFLRLSPEDPTAKLNLACLLLLRQDYENGLELYENRYDVDFYLKPEKKELPKPLFTSDKNNKDKIVYVYYEQGFGDTLNFARYLPVLADMVKQVIFKSQKALYELIKDNFPNIKVISDDINDSQLKYDCHISLVSLLKELKISKNNIISPNGYLKPYGYKINMDLEELFSFEGIKIGLCWNTGLAVNNRNIPFDKLKSIIDFSKNRIYSLQKGLGLEQIDTEEIIRLDPYLNSFYDTAGFIERMDLIITVDTAVAHIAAAMNKPVYVLLNAVPDWRWGLDAETTPWYSSVGLIRQDYPNDWDSVIKKLAYKFKTGLIPFKEIN